MHDPMFVAKSAVPKAWIEQIHGLASSPEDARVWIDIIEAFQPQDGIRAMLAYALVKTVQRYAPDAARGFEAVVATLPRRGGFSFMPVGEAVLLGLHATRLVHPEETLCEGFAAFVTQACEDMFETPVFQILLRAVNGRLEEFLTVSLSQDSFTNYQEQSITRLGERRYEVNLDRGYPAWDERVFLPYLRGLCAHFGVKGEVSFEVRSERASVAYITW
jgi:hypothetical protein